MRSGRFKQTLIFTLAVIAITAGVVTLAASKAYAVAVASYIDLAPDAGDPIDPTDVASAPDVAPSATDTSYYMSYTVADTGFLQSGDIITISIPGSFSNVSACGGGSPDVDIDNDTTTDGSYGTVTGSAFIGWTLQYTMSAATTDLNVELCFEADAPSTQGNYSISISDNADVTNYATSAALIYIGSGDFDNDVIITADVPTVMTLTVREPDGVGTAITDYCNLGVLNPASVNSCSYRVAAGTNHAAGLHVTILADGNLVSGANNIDDIGVADNTINAGTEEYGVIATSGGGMAIQAPFATYDDVPTATAETILNVATPIDDTNTTNWAAITHSASINAGTAIGSYTQTVTYRAFANS